MNIADQPHLFSIVGNYCFVWCEFCLNNLFYIINKIQSYRTRSYVKFYFAASSVSDPDPDPYVLGLPDPHPDPLVRGKVPRICIQIRAKMSRIRNTDKNCASTSFMYVCEYPKISIKEISVSYRIFCCFIREFMKFIWGLISKLCWFTPLVELRKKVKIYKPFVFSYFVYMYIHSQEKKYSIAC